MDAHGSNTLIDNGGVTQVSGRIGSAAQFTRLSNQYLSITDNAALSTGDVDFEWAGFAWLSSKPAASLMYVLGKEQSGSADYVLRYDTSADRFEFLIASSGTEKKVVANTFGSAPIGAWIFVDIWHDSVGDTVNIQINNGPVDSAATAGIPPTDTTQPLQVGGETFFGDNRYWDGRIDSLSFWKRLLSPAERTGLYNGGSGVDYPLQLSGGPASSERLGTPTVSFIAGLTMQPPGIPSLQLLGVPRLQITANPTGVPSLDLPGTPRIQSGLRVAGLASLEALGVARLNLRLSIPGISTQEIIGTPKVNARISLSGIASLEALGIPFIQVVRQIFPSGIASLQNLGTPKLNLRLYLVGIVSLERLGTPFVNIPGTATTLFPAGIISLQNLGTPVVLRGSRILLPSGIPTQELLGAVRFVRALRPGGIPSLQNLGTPRLNLRVLIPGITSLEALGSPRLVRRILPTGIVTLQAVGTPITTRGNKLQPLGILSLEKLGIATLLRGAVLVRPTGFASNEALGLILVSSGFVIIKGTVTHTTLGRSTTTI